LRHVKTRYERAAGPIFGVLGLVFLVTYGWPILQPGAPHPLGVACSWTATAIWVAMGGDYLYRLVTARDRRSFVRRNWLDLVMLALPMLRPLRAVRGLLALRSMHRGGAKLTRHSVVANVAVTVGAAAVVAALAILDAERDAPGSTIRNYGDALWWAMSTIATVGYGDRYPVTVEGRFIAAALMVSGIALLGVITAAIASWFVERVSEMTTSERRTHASIDVLLDEVRALREELAQLRIGLSDHGGAAPR
jgi:voltage-gated potassium channel